MEVHYSGPERARSIPAARLVVRSGGNVEVPDDVGKALIRQEGFTKVNRKSDTDKTDKQEA